jgi:hypothetical protein
MGLPSVNGRGEKAMLKELDSSDWAEVFGEGTGGNCAPIYPQVPPEDTVSTKTFSRDDVVEIKAQLEGENDGPTWIVWGRLKDGRWFFAEGGCDYTGWDCQASNGGAVASTEALLIRYGLTDEERERFGITLDSMIS